MRNRRSGRGFTLVELIILVAIVLIVLAVVVPAVSIGTEEHAESELDAHALALGWELESKICRGRVHRGYIPCTAVISSPNGTTEERHLRCSVGSLVMFLAKGCEARLPGLDGRR